MLALAQALAPEPRLLIIDELSLGLAPAVVEELLDVVAHLKGGGLTTILVEQSVTVALHVASRAVFLEKGTVRFSGAAADLADREDLLRSVFLEGGGRRARPAQAGRVGGRPDSDGRDAPGEVLACAGLTVRFGGLTAVGGSRAGGAGRRDRRAHRPQRRGQDDARRRPLGVRYTRGRNGPVRRCRRHRARAPGCGPWPAWPAPSRTAVSSPA